MLLSEIVRITKWQRVPHSLRSAFLTSLWKAAPALFLQEPAAERFFEFFTANIITAFNAALNPRLFQLAMKFIF
jgi:hypothetical protein